MRSRSSIALGRLGLLTALAFACLSASVRVEAGVTKEEVENAIKEGVKFLIHEQQATGAWSEDFNNEAPTGVTSLVTLALLTAGESPKSPHISRALDFLRRFEAVQLDSVYAVSLQTMVFAAAEPERDRARIARNAAWLEAAQFRAGEQRFSFPGSWTYHGEKRMRGDNSNSQYALLGLNAAAEAGIPVKPEVWDLSLRYWEQNQLRDGSWSYTPDQQSPSASMTCAGVSSLVISGMKLFAGLEVINGENIRDCGRGGANPNLQQGIDWLGVHFKVDQNFPLGLTWKYYYLYGLERVGRLTGQRFLGGHDWYREGAEELVHEQDRLRGFWSGQGHEARRDVATAFALLFLAKGRAPVLINKVRHEPGVDWNNDHDDVRNLVNVVSKDWKHLMTWQVVDPNFSSVEDMLQAPILFMNGHEAPTFSNKAKEALRTYVEQGGFIFAEACCSREGFDRGFRNLIKAIFPEDEYKLKPLPPEHPIWKARFHLLPEIHELYGIEFGCRTVVVYSPKDLSCFWNQSEVQGLNPAVEKSLRVGQNVVDYATGREMPADKLAVRSVKDFKLDKTAPRGALHIGKLRHAGDWNVAPLAIPNLTSVLRDELKVDVVVNHREILPQDPNLIYYPLLYLHGRAAFGFNDDDLSALRKHLEPGGGTIFADAACGAVAFDSAFRKFAGEMYPDNPLTAIPIDDELYTDKVGYDLSDVQYTKAAGGVVGKPRLEGVKLNGRWAIIYSKYDLGCASNATKGSIAKDTRTNRPYASQPISCCIRRCPEPESRKASPI